MIAVKFLANITKRSR